ncbi:MAG: hypothetical protein IJ224_03870 [Lachnospiraceae bacterium]|nr:hypothetical protein [Lachnospiraceae bacterium]
MKKIILIGAFVEIIELCEKCGYSIEGVVDELSDRKFCGYDVLGNDDFIISNKEKFLDSKLIMVPDKPLIREKLYKRYKAAGFSFETVISSGANVSKYAVIEEGAIVQDFCNVSANAHIGRCARLNVGANVMHDSTVGDFSILAPNCVVLGRSSIGEKCYVGANSTILPEKTIGNEAVIGASSVVTKNVGKGLTVIGNPARVMV